MIDVLVAGGGPAGWALAGACARAGLRVELVDPAPERAWRNTYGAWVDDLPGDLRRTAVSASGRGTVVGTEVHRLTWDYAVLHNVALRSALAAPGVRVTRGRVTGVRADRDGVEVACSDGSRRAALVVDATGQQRAVLGGARPGTAAEQTAVGVVVPRDAAASLVGAGEVLFMDWRADHGEPGWPTFLYGVPLDADRVLLEETSLARRPGLPLGVLRRRLHARLAGHGVAVDGVEERVRFTVDTPVPVRRGLVVPFGAAAPLVHPATGFSVAASLQLAPRVAAAVATGLANDPRAASVAAWRTVWSPAALAVHALRRTGLEGLLALEPAAVPRFFDLFFGIPERHRWAYLTGREDVRGTAAAMGALFAGASWPLRRHLVLRGLDPRRATNTERVSAGQGP